MKPERKSLGIALLIGSFVQFFVLMTILGIMVVLSIGLIPFIGSLIGPKATLYLMFAIIPGLFAAVELFTVVAGIGLLFGKDWALKMAFIVSWLNFLFFPVGTVMAVYVFKVWWREKAIVGR